MARGLYRRFVLFVSRMLTTTYVRKYEFVGREHVPKDGPLIVASNHLNNADPPFLARALGRPPIFMAKKEMVEMPVFGLAFRAWGVFPVRRGEPDRAALRAAEDVLRRGEVLLMFPEGTRSRTGSMNHAHPGTGLIALRTGAPILPMAITGSEGIRWPHCFLKPLSVRRVLITIGEPFTLPPVTRINTESARDATEQIMRHVARLLPSEYRGVYRDDIPTTKESVGAGLKTRAELP
ncbi:MAG: lysophospholipid acyltransferase family protein [Dehalococcoidia bacterium]